MKVIENESRVQNLQGRHGGWTDDMKCVSHRFDLSDIIMLSGIKPTMKLSLTFKVWELLVE